MNIINKCIDPISVPRVTGTTLRILRCGKCVNCIKQRKNELAVRTYREFVGQRIAFLTFTYDDDNCPIQVTHIDKEGNVSSDIVRGKDTDFFQNAPFTWRLNKDKKRTKRYKPLIKDDDDGMYVHYFTVYYDDLKKAIKRFRIKHPRCLKQFIAVPEYGSVGYRPHYHMLLFGMDDSLLADLVNEWPYGHVDVDNGSDPNKPNDPERISKYIAKYCVKGDFDCPYIKKSFCRKPRRSVSTNFGLGSDFETLKKVHMCTDELGISSPWDEVELTDRQLSLLASRRAYMINGVPYPLPKYLVNKMFKRTIKIITYKELQYDYIYPYKPKEVEVTRRFKLPLSADDKQVIADIKSNSPLSFKVSYHTESSPLQNKVANYILSRLVSDARRTLQSNLKAFNDVSEVCESYRSNETSEKDLSERLQKDYQRQLECTSLY